jgi:hypothetical protein
MLIVLPAKPANWRVRWRRLPVASDPIIPVTSITAHELARRLLAMPDVLVTAWDEGVPRPIRSVVHHADEHYQPNPREFGYEAEDHAEMVALGYREDDHAE